jgi:8-oxo-dGTP pyrophosphatase MutT (NUDIX family)
LKIVPMSKRVDGGVVKWDANWLRRTFHEGERCSEVHEDGARLEALRPAAVLVPVVLRPAELSVLLTRRTDHLHHHPGQISFPGGRVEAHDVSPVMTALRETEEEIGLDPERVELLGELPDYCTGTGFRVTPVVGLVHPPFELKLDAFEVAEAFEVPLSFLLDPANHQRHRMEYQGRMREYYAMPYGNYFIWGATAGMLVSLYRFLSER